MLATGLAVTGYRSMRFTDGEKWWLYQGPTSALGTSLCYRRDWWQANPFDTIRVGEDGNFVNRALSAKQLSTAAAGDLMFATNHAGNTSPRQIQGNCWKVL